MEPLALTAGAAVATGVTAIWRLHRRACRAEAEAASLRRELLAERHAASHDPLTGLPNRRAFHRLGAELVADPARHPLIAIVLDLDDFKQINDRFGHAAGDEVLVTVARRLARYAGNNLVARLGGDEFAGLLTTPTVDERRLDHAIQTLSDTLAAPMEVAGHLVTVTASVGLVPMQGSAALTEALRHADAAMYRAKTSGQCAYAAHSFAGKVDSFTDDLVGRSAIRPSAVVRDLQPQVAELQGWLSRQPGFPPGPPRQLVETTPRIQAGG